ncbi:hypothetical protein UO65_5305 [Actinokineospora spheciospongiae]|uniref:Uncharacterized protein n=1 Tax=Actinokineospora spheciospongiae TaxID=909613 RepID=W7IZ81_9PSEU|nr:hypothetical protein UO65_5305 [Actinokineospora spheciospongiae]
MPNHRRRLDPPRPPQPRQRHHDRPQRGLHDLHPGQRVRVTEHVRQVPVDVRCQRPRALVEEPGECRARRDQFLGHAHPLAALTGEHEHRAGRRGHLGRDRTGHRAVVLRALGHRGQRAPHRRVVGPGDDRAVVERGARRDQGKPDVEPRGTEVGREQPGGLRPQRRRGPPGQHPRHRRRFGRGFGGRFGFRNALQDHVRVRAADAEGRHRRPPGPVHLGPVHGLGEQFHRARRPVHVRGRLVDVQRPGHHAVPHRQDHLDHARDACRRLGMADVRLDRSQQQRPFAVLPVGGQQGLRLDRVAQGGARAVRLHHVDVERRQLPGGQRLPDDALLRRAVRRGQPVRRAVLVHRRTPHHRQHPVTVATRVRQPFQRQHPDALGPARAVGGLGERLAPAVGGHAPLPGELHERVRRGHDRHTTGEGERALPRAQRLRGQVQRHQRRRARRVHRDRRALEAQRVRHPAGGDAGGAAADAEALVLGVAQQVRVVAVHDPGEHPGAAAPQRVRVQARALQRLPRRLQEQALLRVGGQRLARAHPEELRVELARVVQEAAGARVGRAGVVGVGVVEGVQVPASVVGEPGDGVDPVGDHPPQVLRGGHPARVAARHADDRDRLAALALQLLDALASGAEVDRDAPQVVDDLVLLLIHRSFPFQDSGIGGRVSPGRRPAPGR